MGVKSRCRAAQREVDIEYLVKAALEHEGYPRQLAGRLYDFYAEIGTDELHRRRLECEETYEVYVRPRFVISSRLWKGCVGADSVKTMLAR